MSFTLTGLQEFSRRIEAEQAFFIERTKSAIDKEIAYLREKIAVRLGSLGSYVDMDLSEDILSLRYNIGMKKSGKPDTSARDYHNPGSPKFNITGQRQPFQDVLTEEGYIDISPGPGEAIPVSHGSAPGIRITAKMGLAAVARLERFINGGIL